MITIGIDVAKDTLVGVVLNRSFKALESFTLPNNEEHINTWLKLITQKYSHLLIASEATAEYHRAIALGCLRYKIPFRLLNPIVTKQFIRSTIRKRKTDLTDAETIAKLALTGEGNLVTEQSFEITKSYSRTAAKLVQVENKLHLMQLRLKGIAPEDQLSIGSLDKCIHQLKETVSTLRKQANLRVDNKKSLLLQSLPGVGETIAAILVAEIGDINQFKSGKSLVAYAGLDPRVKQSGKGLKHNTKLTKRGSPYLRQALYQAAFVARVHDPELKAYYLKKKAEGKKYKEATVAT
jgi:transposase